MAYLWRPGIRVRLVMTLLSILAGDGSGGGNGGDGGVTATMAMAALVTATMAAVAVAVAVTIFSLHGVLSIETRDANFRVSA